MLFRMVPTLSTLTMSELSRSWDLAFCLQRLVLTLYVCYNKHVKVLKGMCFRHRIRGNIDSVKDAKVAVYTAAVDSTQTETKVWTKLPIL